MLVTMVEIVTEENAGEISLNPLFLLFWNRLANQAKYSGCSCIVQDKSAVFNGVERRQLTWDG